MSRPLLVGPLLSFLWILNGGCGAAPLAPASAAQANPPEDTWLAIFGVQTQQQLRFEIVAGKMAPYRAHTPPVGPMPKIDTVLLEVDAPHQTVVLSAGSEEGVKLGYTFSVFQGDAFWGRVKVLTVNPWQAVATYDGPPSRGTDPAPGDRACTRLLAGAPLAKPPTRERRPWVGRITAVAATGQIQCILPVEARVKAGDELLVVRRQRLCGLVRITDARADPTLGEMEPANFVKQEYPRVGDCLQVDYVEPP